MFVGCSEIGISIIVKHVHYALVIHEKISFRESNLPNDRTEVSHVH